MSRPLRLEYENAWYHVMNRGAGYRAIYRGQKHRALFLGLLEETHELFGMEVHAYCLMGNHYHLLLRTPRANLSRGMRHINGVYTQRYNRLEKTDGPLFRGRYKAICVEEDSYLLQVSRYIHLNPVEANLKRRAEDYTWSSYASYIGIKPRPRWLYTQYLLEMISKTRQRYQYQRFVESGNDEDTQTFYTKAHLPVVFGSEAFKTRLLSTLDEDSKKSQQPDYRRNRMLPSMEKIIQQCEQYFKLNREALCYGQRGYENRERELAIYLCRFIGGYPLAEIAHYFGGITPQAMSKIIGKVKVQLSSARSLDVQKEIRKLADMILV